jgi:hypothetical protein
MTIANRRIEQTIERSVEDPWWLDASLAAVVALLSAVLILFHWSPLEASVGSGFDSGVFAYCARALRLTGDLYRFCTDNKPPGIFLVYALADSASVSVGVWPAVWCLAWISISLTWVLVARILRPALGSRSWLLAIVGVFSTYLIIDGTVTVEVFSLPFQILVLVSAARMFKSQESLLWTALGGAASVMLFMLRANNVGASVLLLLGVAHLLMFSGSRMLSLRHAIAMTVGGVFAGVVVMFLAGGVSAVTGLVDFAIQQNRGYSSAQQSSRVAAALSGVAWAFTLLPMFMVGTAVSVREVDVPNVLRGLLKDPWSRATLVWLLAEVVFCAVSARRFPHYAQLLLVPSTVVCGQILSRFWQVADRVQKSAPSLKSVLLLCLITCASGLLAVAPVIRQEARGESDERVTRRYFTRLTNEARRLGASSGGLFLWGLPPVVYLSLGVSSPTRFISPVTLATPSFSRAEFFDETVECLAGTMPSIILDGFDATVLGLNRGPSAVPNLVELPAFAKIRAFVLANYTYEQRLAGTEVGIWKRLGNVKPHGNGRDCRAKQGTWSMP